MRRAFFQTALFHLGAAELETAARRWIAQIVGQAFGHLQRLAFFDRRDRVDQKLGIRMVWMFEN